MSAPLVLSLFPGIGLLDMAFEEQGFCVVRGPDLLWGGDIHRFHPPAGKFDGVIGGPPCQAFSQLRHIVQANGFKTAPNLIPEYERCVGEAQPDWFLMENVPAAPKPLVEGYVRNTEHLRDVWVGGETARHRVFTFGRQHRNFTRPTTGFYVQTLALHTTQPEPAVNCDLRRRPVALGGSGKRKPNESGGRTSSLNRGGGAESLERMLDLQGLPSDFFGDHHAAFTQSARKRMIGNGVPLPMGRAVAKAVWRAMYGEREEAAAHG